MFKLPFFILSLLLLSSCTGRTPVQESLPLDQATPPVSSFSTGSSSSDVSEEANSQTNTSSVMAPTKTGATVTTEILSVGTKKLIELQKEKGPNALLEINCSKYDAEGKKFCTSQQALVKKFNEETITWEETLKKGPDYIKTFDCKKITNEFGQKYCNEYQIALTIESNIKK